MKREAQFGGFLLCVGLVVIAFLISVSTIAAQSNGDGQKGQSNNGGENDNARVYNVPCLLPPPPPGQPHPGVQASGVAIPCPMLDIARFLPIGPQPDPDVVFENQLIDQQFVTEKQRLAAAQDFAIQ